jgi:hypothetical protein
MFNEQHRDKKYVQEFLKCLGIHSGKKDIEARTGKSLKTQFTSTSARLN